MPRVQISLKSNRFKTALLILLLLFGHFAYFQHSRPGWNVNSRFALTLALARDGTTEINQYVSRPETETGDVATKDGKYFSDKSIGLSLLGVPAMLMIDAVADSMAAPVTTDTRRTWLTILTVALSGAIGGGVFFLLLCRLNDRLGPSADIGPLLITFGIFGGTVFTLYGSLYMSYMPATAFLLMSFVLVERQLDRDKRGSTIAFGMIGGIGVLCEYLFGLIPVVWAIVTAWRKRSFQFLGLYGLGGALTTLIPLVMYLYSSFGGLYNPYLQHANPDFREGMSKGLMGATWPNLDALLLLTFHPYKGLFVHSCFLLLAVPGLWMWAKSREKILGWASAVLVLFYLLYNSAYYMWWGGWSFGPRHLIPMLPFLGILMLPVLRLTWMRRLAICGVVVSIALHAMVAAVEPQLPDRVPGLATSDLARFDYPNPFAEYIWPQFWQGEIDSNLGSTILGLPRGPLSLFPWVAWWMVFSYIACRFAKRRNISFHGDSEKALP